MSPKAHPAAALPRVRTVGLGWKPDLPDFRDHAFTTPRGLKLPTKVDLRTSGMLPPVWDQGQLGSCTGHGVGAVLAYALKLSTGVELNPSRLFIYYNERVMENTVGQDAGAQIRDGIKAVAKLGAASETDWPYDIAKFAKRPPTQAYANALNDVALKYSRVRRDRIRHALASGHAVVFGFTVYSSFQSGTEKSKGFITPMPQPGEAIDGGHCVVVVGYDDAKQAYLIRNSWGDWCDRGYYWMPYAYLANRGLASDFWTITAVGKAVA